MRKLTCLAVLLGLGSPAATAQEAAPAPAPAARGFPLEVVAHEFPENLAREIAPGEKGWLPWYVELRPRSDRTVAAELVGIIEQPEEGSDSKPVPVTVRRRVEVPPGAPTRAWLYLPYRATTQYAAAAARFRVEAAGAAVEPHQAQVGFGTSPDELPVPMIVTGEHTQAARSPWGEGELQLGNRKITTSRIVRMEEKQLPNHHHGYPRTGLLVLRNFDEKAMEPAQTEAIRRWVFTGGWVVLVPSPKGEIFRTALARGLLPGATIGDPQAMPGFVPGSLLHVEKGGEGRRRGGLLGGRIEVEDVTFRGERPTYTLVDPVQADAGREIYSVARGSEETDERGVRIYQEAAFGDGRVGILALDDLTHGEVSLPFRQKLWTLILAGEGRGGGSRAQGAARLEEERLVGSIQLGLSRKVGIWFIACLVVGYLTIVGPGIYFLLRKLGRLASIVWVEPVVVVLYLGIIAGTAYITKGILTRMRSVSVVHHAAGEPYALRAGYLGLFSADETVYRVASPGSDEVRLAGPHKQPALDLDQGSSEGPAVRGVRLAKWATRTFVSSALIEAPAGYGVEVEAERERTEAGEELKAVHVRNRTDLRFERAFFLDQGVVYALGEVAPGAERTVRGPLTKVETAAVQPAAGAGEDPLGTDRFQRDVLKPHLDTLHRSAAVFTGLIERDAEDFTLDHPATLEARADLYVEYR